MWTKKNPAFLGICLMSKPLTLKEKNITVLHGSVITCYAEFYSTF